MNVFYNGSIQARKIVGIKNRFMVVVDSHEKDSEPNGNYVLEFEDGSHQEVSFEFMNKWSVPKPSILVGGGLKEGQIIADVDSDNEKVETNLVLGYFLEFEDGRNAYVCQKVFDAWYLNVPCKEDYFGEFEGTPLFPSQSEIYDKLVTMEKNELESYVKCINTSINTNLGMKENLNLLERMNFRAESMVYFMKGMAIMEIVLFILLLISLFN